MLAALTLSPFPSVIWDTHFCGGALQQMSYVLFATEGKLFFDYGDHIGLRGSSSVNARHYVVRRWQNAGALQTGKSHVYLKNCILIKICFSKKGAIDAANLFPESD
ncbi:hypothetical protein KIN20_034660 [Parelaphostrongylus tenuis]|uniref:Uncharacterized protein n=1 Tax=Parelaphostrongylus tenuis TaxID=148309 RepID=A0AAD5WK78_PARTN|nr:hypothetical protein KIN20_034660 [Parelaphostrongylus tenuis]